MVDATLRLEGEDRIIFLDKMRYSLVLGVVVLHSACAYANIIPWWSVWGPVFSPFFDLLIVVLDIFLMPVLFFISGYFTPSSLNKRGSGQFINAKLKRLGIPFILVGIFFVPLISFIGYRGRTPDAQGFFQFWWMQMQTVLDLHWVNYATEQTALRHVNDFSQWHLWFISLLLLFFIVTAFVHRFFPQCFQQEAPLPSGGSLAIFSGLSLAALVGALGFALINRTNPDWTWGKMGGLIMIQPTRLPLYLSFFALGIHANTRGWFRECPWPGSSWLWLAGCTVSSLVFLAFLGAMGQEPVPLPWSHALAHGILRSLTCLAFLGLFVTASQHRGNRPSLLWRHLHPISYDIYLMHLPLVVVLQLVLLALPISIFGKFFIIVTASISLCWILGRYVIESHPVRASGLLLAAFALGCKLVG